MGFALRGNADRGAGCGGDSGRDGEAGVQDERVLAERGRHGGRAGDRRQRGAARDGGVGQGGGAGDGSPIRRARGAVALGAFLLAGCSGPRVVFVPSADAPVRAGPGVRGRVYVWTGSTWELSLNRVPVPEGFYIWDAGDPAPRGE